MMLSEIDTLGSKASDLILLARLACSTELPATVGRRNQDAEILALRLGFFSTCTLRLRPKDLLSCTHLAGWLLGICLGMGAIR